MSLQGFYVDFTNIHPQQYYVQNINPQYYRIFEINKQLEEKNKELKKKIDLLENENKFQKK